MSQRDKDILKELDLVQADVARALGLSRQAVAYSVSRPDNYLEGRKLIQIYWYLAREKPAKAEIVLRFIEREFKEEAALLAETTDRIADQPAETEFHEMWVLSREPQELTPAYFNEMKKHFEEEGSSVCYFVPPGDTSHLLSSRFRHYLDGRPEVKGVVHIIEWPVVEFLPHMVILDPTSDARCMVQLPPTKGFAELPSAYATRMVTLLTSTGVLEIIEKGASPNGPVVTPPLRSLEEGYALRLVYSHGVGSRE